MTEGEDEGNNYGTSIVVTPGTDEAQDSHATYDSADLTGVIWYV
jgi:hypothetical protein